MASKLHDLAVLQILDEDSILSALKARYEESFIYTRCGGFLIALNPWRKLEIYSKQIYGQKPIEHLPPHCFLAAETAYRQLIKERMDQTILIGGESGAGKTETTKFLLQHLSACQQYHATISDDMKLLAIPSLCIAEQVLASNPILESFGNSRTLRNNNSSRFGKFIKMLYESDRLHSNHRLVGARIDVYLLERSRIVYVPEGESNYHIFHQIREAAAAVQIRADLKDCKCLREVEVSMLLEKFVEIDNVRILGMLDSDKSSKLNASNPFDFESTLEAMKRVGMQSNEVLSVMQIVAAVMNLGNIGFFREDSKNSTDIAQLQEGIAPTRALEATAYLLGLEKEVLLHALTRRSVRGLEVLFTLQQAEEARDALCRALFSNLFLWLVSRLNDLLDQSSAVGKCPSGEPLNSGVNAKDENSRSQIGILDIFGFESLEKNSLEQLCINYANEKLQLEFSMNILYHQQDEYSKEEIAEMQSVSCNITTTYVSNEPIILLLEEKVEGILSVIHDFSCILGSTTAGLIDKLKSRSPPHEFLKVPRTRGSTFAIHHYAGNVQYDASGLLERNRDHVGDILTNIVKHSSNAFFRAFLPVESSVTPTKQAGTVRRTLVSEFRRQLSGLVASIKLTHQNYIRCINPNPQKVPNKFDWAYVLNQLRYGGVIQAVRVARAAFPARYPYRNLFGLSQFLLVSKRLESALSTPSESSDCQNLRDAAERLLYDCRFCKEDFELGKTKVFLCSKGVERLNFILVIDSHILAARLRRNYHQKMDARIALQSHFQRLYAVIRLKQFKDASDFLQGKLHTLLESGSFRARSAAAVYAQAKLRALLVRGSFRTRTQAVLYLQARLRCRWKTMYWRGSSFVPHTMNHCEDQPAAKAGIEAQLEKFGKPSNFKDGIETDWKESKRTCCESPEWDLKDRKCKSPCLSANVYSEVKEGPSESLMTRIREQEKYIEAMKRDYESRIKGLKEMADESSMKLASEEKRSFLEFSEAAHRQIKHLEKRLEEAEEGWALREDEYQDLVEAFNERKSYVPDLVDVIPSLLQDPGSSAIPFQQTEASQDVAVESFDKVSPNHYLTNMMMLPQEHFQPESSSGCINNSSTERESLRSEAAINPFRQHSASSFVHSRHSCVEDHGLDDQILRVHNEFTNSVREADIFGMKDDMKHLVLVGVPGNGPVCGKRIVMNSLADCNFRQLNQEDADSLKISTEALLGEKSEGRGSVDPISTTDNKFGDPCAHQFRPVELPGVKLSVWDVPGMQDICCSEVHSGLRSIANAVNLTRLLNATQRHGKGVIIMVVLDVSHLDSDKGASAFSTIEAISRLLSSRGAQKQQNDSEALTGIIFCVAMTTKVQFTLDDLRRWVTVAASNFRMDLKRAADRIIMYDPLGSHQEAIQRDQLIHLVLDTMPLNPRCGEFVPCINAEELLLIQEISNTIAKKISTALTVDEFQFPDFQEVRHYAEFFRTFTEGMYDIPNIKVQLQNILSLVGDKLLWWENQSILRKDDVNVEGRRSSMHFLNILERALSNLGDLIMDRPSMCARTCSLKEKLKQAELAHQRLKLFELTQGVDLCLPKVLKILSKELSSQPFPIVLYDSEDPSLWSSILKRFCRSGSRELTNKIQELQQFSQDVQDVKVYIWGDQIGCKTSAERKIHIVHDAAISIYLRSQIDTCGCELALQARNKIREGEKHSLGEKLLTVCDEEPLKNFGFSPTMENQMSSVLKLILHHRDKDVQAELIERCKMVFVSIHTQALRTTIERINASGDFRTKILPLKEALDKLKSVGGPENFDYLQSIENVKIRINAVHKPEMIQTLIEAKHYSDLLDLCETMKKLQDALMDHLEINSEVLHCAASEQAQRLMKKATSNVESILKSKEILDLTGLKEFMAVYSVMKCQFVSFHGALQELQKSAEFSFDKIIDVANYETFGGSDDDINERSNQEIADMLVKICEVAMELNMSSRVRDQIRNRLLAHLSDRDRYKIGLNLTELASSLKVSSPEMAEMARTVLDTYPEFKNFNIEAFNKRCGGVSFADALRDLKSSPEKSKTDRAASLRALQMAFSCYEKTFSAKLNLMVLGLERFPEKFIKEEIDCLAEQMDATSLGAKPKVFGDFLGLISSLWTYLAAKGCNQHGIEQKYLKQPNATQILGVLRLLGLDQAQLENHLIEVKTGEGKSIALGLTAAVLSKLKCKVDVVCYNAYLSERDHREFSELFKSLGVQNKVTYSGFDHLFERIMKDNTCLPNVRKSFSSLLSGKSSALPPTNAKTERSILLIDEVDVFVSEEFYSKTFNPSICIGGYDLIRHVWKKRDDLLPLSEFTTGMLNRSETKTIKSKHKNLADAFLLREFESLYNDVNRFPPDVQKPNLAGVFGELLYDDVLFPPDFEKPNLAGVFGEWILDEKRQKIGYLNQGVPDFKTSYGYITAFTYFHLYDKKKVDENKIKERVYLDLKCGELLYSQIPKYYDFTLGMSGTLSYLSSFQNKLLEKYDIKQVTYLPTTFSKRVINAHQEAELTETMVIRGSYEEYVDAVLKDIFREHEQGRAILVIFESLRKLECFRSTMREITARSPKIPSYSGPLLLTDDLNREDRDRVVTRAVRRYAVTLMTRSFGRGTDFVCRDEGLRMNGGVHVILTFYPESESENIQILGRTCRQNDPGSSRKILFENDLVNLGASEQEKMKSGNNWDEYLIACRASLQAARHDNATEQHRVALEKHNLTLAACDAVAQDDWKKATECFLALHE